MTLMRRAESASLHAREKNHEKLMIASMRAILTNNEKCVKFRKYGEVEASMKVQDSVKKATLTIASGTLLLTGVMLLIFVLLGQFELPVLLGALLGAAAAILNFFLMGLSVQKMAERSAAEGSAQPPSNADEDGKDDEDSKPDSPYAQQAKKSMQLSYGARMLMMVAVAVLALSLPCFHPIATVLPMLFPRLVIFAQQFLLNKEA